MPYDPFGFTAIPYGGWDGVNENPFEQVQSKAGEGCCDQFKHDNGFWCPYCLDKGQYHWLTFKSRTMGEPTCCWEQGITFTLSDDVIEKSKLADIAGLQEAKKEFFLKIKYTYERC